MMHTVAVFDKKSLVITRSRHRAFTERQAQGNALRVAWVLDTDDPGVALRDRQ